ncbi:sulfur carrier protein ThiS [Gulosibacter sp. 10]|uniref:sulfur carrier protein ThiS n=1 Tax=Gulosibacter sp. 10 TaxID=1255570 RepID=UPI00097F0F1C|nr:sulfur carrier protein ThiS [Gulosibacter sp. 10]SJM57514.1 thiamine biosynthesis protein ThiS [Gulosibacter sp. 10]
MTTTPTPQADTIAITINGSPAETAAGGALLDAVAAHTGRELLEDGTAADGERLGIAAAVNGVVIPRSLWAARGLEAADELEIVTAAQGG